jgi:hypothetical protein
MSSGWKTVLASTAILALLAVTFYQPTNGQSNVIGPLYLETATIANGASLSGTIDTKGRTLVGIEMPAAWTAASMTYQVSMDGANWRDLYNGDGDELTTAVSTSRFVAFSWYEFLPVRYVKIRSGSSGTPVNQGGARTLTIVTRKVSD